jgi:hypothetical protein
MVMGSSISAEIVTVYRMLDGSIYHRRCGQKITLKGQRAGLEVDFYCFTCAESVTLPFCVLGNIPVADGAVV